jgi:hypothetical protein
MSKYYLDFRNACENGNLKKAKWLVQEYMLDVYYGGRHVLYLACQNNQIEIVKWLV